MTNAAPIGVFDSGVGGLTVVKALRLSLPNETLFYLGDTARVPYGTKSPDVVTRYALNCARFLVRQGAKALVIACNTASAVAVNAIAEAFSMPVLGVIEPGARMAAEASLSGRIGVIGTEGTIHSGRYQTLISDFLPSAQVIATPCPMFVPLAEEGLAGHPAARMLAKEYLAPLIAERIDTLVLGCTHYPLLESLLQSICGPEVTIITSAKAVAREVGKLLSEHALDAQARGDSDRFYLTDVGQRFSRVGAAFLGSSLHELEWVDVA